MSIYNLEPQPSHSSAKDDVTVGSTDLGPGFLKDSNLYRKCRPFKVHWTYGLNNNVPIINLTKEGRTEIFYAASHIGIIYNYCTKKMKHLEAHQNEIISASADQTGRWLATSDWGVDNTIIVWDTFECVPVRTIFNSFPEGAALVQMSYTAKYLMAVGYDYDIKVNFWQWSLGKEPDDKLFFKITYGSAKQIVFNCNCEEHIMLIFEKHMVLLQWDLVQQKLCNITHPTVIHKSTYGNLTGGSYIKNCHECFVSTLEGYVLKFGNSLYALPFEEKELNNVKMFINAMKVTNYQITTMTAVNELLVIGDESGLIQFFDKLMKLLYWQKKFDIKSILCFAFNSVNINYEEVNENNPIQVKGENLWNNNKVIFECSREKEVEEFVKKGPSLDCTLEMNEFVINDCFILAGDGNIYAVNFLKKTCMPLFMIADDYVTAIECHSHYPFLVVGYNNGRISIINFETKELVMSNVLPSLHGEDDDVAVTAIKYSSNSYHLVCGRHNGEIWVLEPVLGTPKEKEPFRPESNKIKKIDFSEDGQQFAYIDIYMTAFLFSLNCANGKWVFKGKIRSHYRQIHDLLFLRKEANYQLFTIGEDRYMIGYNNVGILPEEDLSIVVRERVCQTSIPKSFMYIKNENNVGRFLVADNQYKLKTIDEKSLITRSIVLGPAYGVYKNHPISKLMLLPKKSNYFIFLSNNHIGLHMLPADGNPYRYIGYLAHPIKVSDFALSYDGKQIFTFGTMDNSIMQWEIRFSSVEYSFQHGGTDIEPFYCLLEGGKNGYLFQEIQDLFFYMQILHQGENIVIPRKVSDFIAVSEIPDLVRACGFYPTEYEIEDMVIDIKYRNVDRGEEGIELVSFFDFIKLYINHKPAHGYTLQHLEDCFELVCQSVDDPLSDMLTQNDFLQILTSKGEFLSITNLYKCLAILLREEVDTSDVDFYFLPEELTFDVLVDNILGIDMERDKLEYNDVNEFTDSVKEEEERESINISLI